jgi:hypothetical protein
VWVSDDGVDWHSLGFVGGSTAGVDLDAYGFDSTDAFRYVRLQDDPDSDDQSGDTVGADIDAAGAISTNRAPVARDDAYTTPAYHTLTVAVPGVLVNDADPENDALTVVVDSQPSHGALEASANGSLTYEPLAGFVGSDSFRYHVGDPSGNASGPAVVTIDVTGCGEDGLGSLEGTPAEGAASRVVHEVEPVANGIDESLGATVHQINCDVVVPLEDVVDELP